MSPSTEGNRQTNPRVGTHAFDSRRYLAAQSPQSGMMDGNPRAQGETPLAGDSSHQALRAGCCGCRFASRLTESPDSSTAPRAFPFVLRFRLGGGLPLHVSRRIGASTRERLYMVDNVPLAWS